MQSAKSGFTCQLQIRRLRKSLVLSQAALLSQMFNMVTAIVLSR